MSCVAQTGRRSQPALAARTASGPGAQRLATAFISRSSDTTTPSYFSSRRSRPSITRGESVAGTSSSSARTRTCAVMIDATPASIALRKGRSSTSSSRERECSTVGISRCESRSVSPWPGKCFAQAATPPPCRPPIIAAPSRPTRSGSAPNERSPMTGFFGLVSTSTTGAKSSRMPQACSSAASACPIFRAVSSEPCRPSARKGGHSVHGARMRATRPPSWSTETRSGRSCPAARASDCSSRTSSATCSGEAMLRANRITLPAP